MQVSPWLGLGPWLPHLTHFSCGGTSLPRPWDRRWQTKLLASEGLPSEGKARPQPRWEMQVCWAQPPDTQDPQESQPGASPGDSGQNELISQWEDSGRWLPNTTARRQTQKLRNTASTTKGTPALLRNYQVAPPAGLSDALNPAPLPAHGPVKQNRG